MTIVRFDPFRAGREFDRLANQVMGLTKPTEQRSVFKPAYDIEQHSDDAYMIHVALPGVAEDAIDVTAHDGVLTVSSKASDSDSVNEAAQPRALYQGIGRGKFERRFRLADHVEVQDARLANGILSISLVRQVPDALKPRSIKVLPGTEARPEGAATPVVSAA